MILILMLQI